MTIPKQAVEAAAKVSWNFHADKYPSIQNWDALNEIGRAEEMKMQRAALEAALPLMGVQQTDVVLRAACMKLRTALDALRPFPLVVEPVAAALIAEADAALTLPAQSSGVMRREEQTARIVEIVGASLGPLNATERADLAEDIDAVLALPHTGQPQEGALRKALEPFVRFYDDIRFNLRKQPRPTDAAVEERGERNAVLTWADFYALQAVLSAAPASPRAEGEKS